MVFTPEALPPLQPFFQDASGQVWTPMYSHECAFGPDVFREKMMNLIRNPNLNSSWLNRADILYDTDPDQAGDGGSSGVTAESSVVSPPELVDFRNERTIIRKLVPRNEQRDAPLIQTCIFYQSTVSKQPSTSLAVYVPQCKDAASLPFYHPRVQGVAHAHEWNDETNKGTISIHFLAFPDVSLQEEKLVRTAYHLLEILDKHGRGAIEGYVKRVQHDVVVPRAKFQDTFGRLKAKYARSLMESWAESTDPSKHVFEDLSIAAFLIELWADMYKDNKFPGFVDIGCGNGLLVYLLCSEGYTGYGFDARERKSWQQYNTSVDTSPSGRSLEQRLLLPALARENETLDTPKADDSSALHDGTFAAGTFIISNHADELTPWTPILAAQSQCPFIMIPCCSHKLTAEKFRAPPPRDKSKPKSQYASLVDWVTQIAEDCGWEVETEMMRIPSTRNIGLLGRKRTKEYGEVDLPTVVNKYGGTAGYAAAVEKLLKAKPRGH